MRSGDRSGGEEMEFTLRVKQAGSRVQSSVVYRQQRGELMHIK